MLDPASLIGSRFLTDTDGDQNLAEKFVSGIKKRIICAFSL